MHFGKTINMAETVPGAHRIVQDRAAKCKPPKEKLSVDTEEAATIKVIGPVKHVEKRDIIDSNIPSSV